MQHKNIWLNTLSICWFCKNVILYSIEMTFTFYRRKHMMHHYWKRESSASPTINGYSRDSTVILALKSTDIFLVTNEIKTRIWDWLTQISAAAPWMMWWFKVALMLVLVRPYCSINQPSLTPVLDIHTKPMTPLWTKLIPLWRFHSWYFMVGKVPPFSITLQWMCNF